MASYWQGQDVYVQDLLVGADPEYTLPVRVVSQLAWHSLFGRQLFIRPNPSDSHPAQFTILLAPEFQSNTAEHATNSETAIVITFKTRVVVDSHTRVLHFDADEITENTRAAYPLDFIDNAVMPSVGGHPSNVIFLTADAFGVLPPVSRLTPEQAMYHFLSGYTAKVAGTERGLGKETEATFSAGFGSPVRPRPAATY